MTYCYNSLFDVPRTEKVIDIDGDRYEYRDGQFHMFPGPAAIEWGLQERWYPMNHDDVITANTRYGNKFFPYFDNLDDAPEGAIMMFVRDVAASEATYHMRVNGRYLFSVQPSEGWIEVSRPCRGGLFVHTVALRV